MIETNKELVSARIQFAETFFMSGGPIAGDMLLTLCKHNDIQVDDSTEYLVQTFVVFIYNNGNLSFIRPKDVKKYRLDKCHRLAQTLYSRLLEINK